MANSADPDQLASSEANWTGSTLFAKVGYIRVQQDLSVIAHIISNKRTEAILSVDIHYRERLVIIYAC